MHKVITVVSLLLICLLTVGCGPKPTGGENATGEINTESQTQEAADGVKAYAPADLSVAIGEYMPPLEGGALEIAPPDGWDFKRAGGESLVAFVPAGSTINSLPRIVISVQDCPYAEFVDVDATNVVQFAAKVASDLVADKTLANSPQPLILGENAFARYVGFVKQANAAVAQQSLVTVRNGRMYTVYLEAYERQFQAYRDAGYAAGASMKFGQTTPDPPMESSPATGDAGPDAGTEAEKSGS